MSKRPFNASVGICPNALVSLLNLTEAETDAVEEAARDAHMSPVEYCRLMVLCAAGMGGVAEHVERAFEASADVDQSAAIVIKTRKR